MPVEIDKTQHLARVSLTGRVSAEDITRWFREMLGHPEFSSDMNSLWDLSGASLDDFPTKDVRRVESFMRQFQEVRRGIKAACVCPQDLNFGLARMYEMLAQPGTRVEFRVFRDMREAETWLASCESADGEHASIHGTT